MLTPGAKIGGFLIGDLLGKGAMGEVYKGEQLSLKRPVAIKRIATHLIENEDMVRRFKREAQVLAKVGHPNVVGVIECEEFADETGAKHLLLIMELIEGGRSLKAHLGRPIDWRLATSVVRMCADGLAAAFEQQVVHRDIKPDNIMMTCKGIAKLVDFGLAKAAESTALTMQAAPMGTPLFMSPEACRGEEIGHAGDLYSLGVSWWFMLTGEYPFQAANLHGLLYKHISEPLPPPTGLFDHVPAPVVQLVYQCLHKEPSGRPASAQRLVEAIESLPGQGLLLPRDARELVGAGTDTASPGGSTTAATLVAGGRSVDRTAATVVGGGNAAQDATAATALAGAGRTMAADLSPQGAVAATVVTNLSSASAANANTILTPQAAAAQAATVVAAAPAATVSGGKGGLIAAVIVIVLLIGGGLAWFATRPDTAATTTTASIAQPEPSPPPADPAPPADPTPIPAEPPAPIEPPASPVAPVPVVATPLPPEPLPAEPAPVPAPMPIEAPPAPVPVEPVPEPPKPAPEPPKPAPVPAPIDTTAFDQALAAKDWAAAKAAADALPEPARAESTAQLTRAANAQLLTAMRTARGQFDAQQFPESFATLAAEVPVATYADQQVREQFVRLANLVRETAKQAQE